MRLIDADTLVEEIEYYIEQANWGRKCNKHLKMCIELIENQPTVDNTQKIIEKIEQQYEPNADNKWSQTIIKVWNRAIQMCVKIIKLDQNQKE